MSKNRWAGEAIRSIASVALLSLALAGCMGGSDPSVGHSAFESTLVTPDTAPLDVIAEEAWVAAPDCEGLLAGTVTFRIASLSAGLVACVDSYGQVLCVDSVEAISSDLDESGREAEADALSAGFFAAVCAEDTAVAISRMTTTSDPEPQPNMRPRGLGDPEPQPN